MKAASGIEGIRWLAEAEVRPGVDLDTIAAVRLGAVHRAIGPLQAILSRGVVRSARRDAHADGAGNLLAIGRFSPYQPRPPATY